jgi:hypothetical protein
MPRPYNGAARGHYAAATTIADNGAV